MSMAAIGSLIDEFLQLVRNGELKQLSGLIESSELSVDAANDNGSTALMMASLGGYLDIVSFLLNEKGASLGKINCFGNTALHFASQNGHVKVIKALLEKGADVNLQNKDGYTPLISACVKGESEAAAELLAAGADVELTTSVGNTPLMLSVREGSKHTVLLLLENGADTNRRNKRGETALILAAQDRRKGIVAILLETKYKTNALAKDEDGFTALMMAAAVGHLEIVQLLLAHGAIEGEKSEFNALAVAKENKHAEIEAELHPYFYPESVIDASLRAINAAIHRPLPALPLPSMPAVFAGLARAISQREPSKPPHTEPKPPAPHTHEGGFGIFGFSKIEASATKVRSQSADLFSHFPSFGFGSQAVPAEGPTRTRALSADGLDTASACVKLDCAGTETDTAKTWPLQQQDSSSTDNMSGRPRLGSGATGSTSSAFDSGRFRSISIIEEGVELESPAVNLSSKLNAATGVSRFSPTLPPQPTQPVAEVTPSDAQYAAFSAEHTALQADVVHYKAHKEWARSKEAAKKLCEVATTRVGEARDFVEIAMCSMELEAIEDKQKELVMSPEAFKEFPIKCAGLRERCKEAAQQAVEGAERDRLVALVEEVQELIQSLGQAEPHTAHHAVAAPVAEATSTVVTIPPVQQKYSYKGREIARIRDAFDTKTDKTAQTNPTVRILLRGHFENIDSVTAESTTFPVVLKCATQQGDNAPSEKLARAIEREHSMYDKVQKGKYFTQADGATGCVWCWDVHPQHHYLLLEDFGMDLRRALTKANRNQQDLMEKAAAALCALHSRHIMHGDIKPQNFLYYFDQDGGCNVKLCDLDCAHEVGQECTASILGTPGYYPPETFLAAQRGDKIHAALEMDMFAFGLVLWQVLNWHLESPLAFLSDKELKRVYANDDTLFDRMKIPQRAFYYRPLVHGLAPILPGKRLNAQAASDETINLRASKMYQQDQIRMEQIELNFRVEAAAAARANLVTPELPTEYEPHATPVSPGADVPACVCPPPPLCTPVAVYPPHPPPAEASDALADAYNTKAW